MAEEKIKAAEVMSDEELDGVAGGAWAQTMEIYNEMFKVAKADTEKFGESWQARSNNPNTFQPAFKKFINNFFASGGFDVKVSLAYNAYKDNEYKINGKEVSHKEFMDFLHGFSGDAF